jgi:cytochrome P450
VTSQAGTDQSTADFFTDASLCGNPYPYFESLRSKGPVYVEPHHGVAVVTGHEEAIAVYNDAVNFSACNAVGGPLPPLPFVPEGDDISEQIERYRELMPSSDLLVTYDQPEHPQARGLLMRLFSVRRLQENEAYFTDLADRMVTEVLRRGKAEVVLELGNPFATLVIADLLGVPEEDRETFRNNLSGTPPAPIGEASPNSYAQHPLVFLHERYSAYIEDRRAAPRGDALTHLALAKYPDGSTPSVLEVVRVAVNLFAAGQETTARLLATTLRILAERPDLQTRLRAAPDLIPEFIEEALRLDGPIKANFRLVRRTTKIGNVEVKAGTTVMIAIPTLNRDAERFERPEEIWMDRPRVRGHFAFGRAHHGCPGAPLARVETRVMLSRLLTRTSRIALSEAHHGSEGNRRFEYASTYLIRGLNALHLEFTPRAEAGGSAALT